MSTETIASARRLINAEKVAILSTLSLKLDGFPLGSVVPYCLDGEGMPVILVSTIAEHTKNIVNDNRCSMTVTQDADDPQASGRICVIGNMEPLPADDMSTRERYYRHFPKSKAYSQAHDFFFYRLRPVTLRYIAGFGSIHWLSAFDFLATNPFHNNGERGVIDHMNEDHQKSIMSYCEHYKGLTIEANDKIRMVGIDSFGFDIFVNDKKVRFDFKEPVADAKDARTALVEMSKSIG